MPKTIMAVSTVKNKVVHELPSQLDFLEKSLQYVDEEHELSLSYDRFMHSFVVTFKFATNVRKVRFSTYVCALQFINAVIAKLGEPSSINTQNLAELEELAKSLRTKSRGSTKKQKQQEKQHEQQYA